MENKHNSSGAILSPVDIRDYKIAKDAIAKAFPDKFELDLVKVKDQLNVGSCVAHSLSSITEYHNAKQNTDIGTMSTGFIYGNRKHSLYTGTGMCLRDALSGLLHEGNCSQVKFPENIEVPLAIQKFEERYEELAEFAITYRISSYFKVSTKAEIKTALMNYGPVAFIIPWYSDMSVKKGVMSSPNKDTTNCGYHCMFIYGWDEEGWKIQNSWGIGWGRKGRATMPYDFDILEAYGVTDDIIEGEQLKHPWASWIGNIVAKCINLMYALLNVLKK